MSRRRAPVFYAILLALTKTGEVKVDLPVLNKEGEVISCAPDGKCYMLKQWYAGRECDVYKEKDVVRAVKELALLHTKMHWPKETEDGIALTGRHFKEELLCHNREMKKVRSFIRQKVKKGKFEYLYLQHFEKMYQLALRVAKKLEESGYEELYRESVEERRLIHGDYNYHNVIMLPEKSGINSLDTGSLVAVTGFEHFAVDVQVQDFCYFFRKVMEKHRWEEDIGKKLLEAYESVRPLKKEELEYVALKLAYPEKFWKTANSYYRSNKAWISEKNVSKLSGAIEETEEKMQFLKHIFSLEI